MTFVLVDTSVWIDFFRVGYTKESKELFKYLDTDRVAITSIILCEILSGARNDREFHQLKEMFSGIPILEEPKEFWGRIAFIRFQLARKGIQTSLIDISIAVTVEHHHSLLLTRDKQFKTIASVLPIKLVKID